MFPTQRKTRPNPCYRLTTHAFAEAICESLHGDPANNNMKKNRSFAFHQQYHPCVITPLQSVRFFTKEQLNLQSFDKQRTNYEDATLTVHSLINTIEDLFAGVLDYLSGEVWNCPSQGDRLLRILTANKPFSDSFMDQFPRTHELVAHGLLLCQQCSRQAACAALKAWTRFDVFETWMGSLEVPNRPQRSLGRSTRLCKTSGTSRNLWRSPRSHRAL